MMEASWPEILPAIVLRHFVLFPPMMLPLFVSSEREKAAVDEALASNGFLFLVHCGAQGRRTGSSLSPASIQGSVGCVAKILKDLLLDDGRRKILVQGVAKAKVVGMPSGNDLVQVRVQPVLDVESLPDGATRKLMDDVKALARKLFTLRGMRLSDAEAILEPATTPGRLADLLAQNLLTDSHAACRLASVQDPLRRLRKIFVRLTEELEHAEIKTVIETEAETAIREQQRRKFLREQLRAIRMELGEWNEERELTLYRSKIQDSGMPPEARLEAERELHRLETMRTDAAEASVIRSYLDWLLEMPWNRSSEDRIDLRRAADVLDEDHYDMTSIKERILEFLGVCQLRRSVKGSVLCLVGPPGVGKTSLGRSIARAMGRAFVRVSLGGVRDEAEIRGHRRTYLGAMPGRIIQGLRKAGSLNPVFLLDEIDKIGKGGQGDPASALLEVFDPEQNHRFSDHYLNVPFDLSRVLFITTANSVDPVPFALRDRLEILTLSGYTDLEKIEIARLHLIPRQVQHHGLGEEELLISRGALLDIVQRYSRESGVRQLERSLAALCRKAARRLAEGGRPPFRISRRNLVSFLGPPSQPSVEVTGAQPPGVAYALSWTPYGGRVLKVEVAVMPGKGRISLTGQLGEVLRESVHTALTFLRSRSQQWGLDPAFHEEKDLHVHIPEGAVQKDGPSAGVALCAAMLSALVGRPLRPTMAMTGEMSLLGDVLPVGGLREKLLAAVRSGLRDVLVPAANRGDMMEIPRDVRKGLRIHWIEDVTQALELVMEANGEWTG